MTRLFASLSVAALIAGAAVAAAPASAADLMTQPVSTGYDWTGPFVGLNVVWESSLDDPSLTRSGAYAALPNSVNLDGSSFTGGGAAGYNWQHGRMVIGVEGDLTYLVGHDETRALAAGAISTTFSQELSWFGTARARVGVTPVDRIFVYGSGGLAVGASEVSASCTGGTCTGGTSSSTDSGASVGWIAGAGAEVGLAERIRLKGEAFYYDLGNRSATVTETGGGAVTVNSEFKGVLGRFGLNIAF
jgi:outer membrane immunogenic protein